MGKRSKIAQKKTLAERSPSCSTQFVNTFQNLVAKVSVTQLQIKPKVIHS